VEEYPFTQCLLVESSRDGACTSVTRGQSACFEITCKPELNDSCVNDTYIKVKAAVPSSHDTCFPAYVVDI
jgi:hypothetical protein